MFADRPLTRTIGLFFFVLCRFAYRFGPKLARLTDGLDSVARTQAELVSQSRQRRALVTGVVEKPPRGVLDQGCTLGGIEGGRRAAARHVGGGHQAAS
jgi:hypothetical protein